MGAYAGSSVTSKSDEMIRIFKEAPRDDGNVKRFVEQLATGEFLKVGKGVDLAPKTYDPD